MPKPEVRKKSIKFKAWSVGRLRYYYRSKKKAEMANKIFHDGKAKIIPIDVVITPISASKEKNK